MKNLLRIYLVALLGGISYTTLAGNGDRVGSAGASELLINPWARSAAWADAGISCANGLDAVFTNIAGLAFTDKTQIRFDRTSWLSGAGVNINNAGLAQRVSDDAVVSIAVMTMGFGDIDITTVNSPEGGLGQFSPTNSNFNVGYAREFSNSIYGGINFKVISQSISNVRATGVGIDAGIRYVTGEQDQIKFGITLKNVGPTMRFRGDGLSQLVENIENEQQFTLEQRTNDFELPSMLGIGGSYDFIFDDKQKLTTAVAFNANSFSNDQFRLGLNYNYELEKASFNVMAGYMFEQGIFSSDFNFGSKVTALSGFAAGVAVDAITAKTGSRLGIQYAFRATSQFNGIHTLGVSIDMK